MTSSSTGTARKRTSTGHVTADVSKSGNTVSGRFALKNLPILDPAQARKRLFAVVGVADLALEQVRVIPGDVGAEARKVSELLAATGKQVPATIKTLPVSVKAQLDAASDRATEVYTGLAVRGERLVTQIRRQPATETALVEGKRAAKKAEAAVASARRSAKAGEKAVGGAASKIG